MVWHCARSWDVRLSWRPATAVGNPLRKAWRSLQRAVCSHGAWMSIGLALACASVQAQGPDHGTAAAARAPAHPTAEAKVLRYAFPVAESSFDPAQISDLYSRTVTAGIFEAPYGYDYLARPFKLKPLTAAAMPEVSNDFTRFVVRIQPGIFFADDPAFGGRRRELTAHDHVYALKRHYDPRWNSPSLYVLENAKLLGLDALRQRALARKAPFDYDAEVPGLRVLDRYRFEVRLAEPAPRFAQEVLSNSAVFGAVAREVVEFYGDKITDHPVGTGPFVLAEWRRSARIVLQRNPGYRVAHYDAEPPAGDAVSQAIAHQLAGRRLPMVDRVEISVIDEEQPRWLSFLNAQSDLIERVPAAFVEGAAPNGRLAPHLARRGIRMDRAPVVDAVLATFFNHDDPLVGGNAPEKVALRRAIALAYDSPREIRLVRRNQAVPAQTVIAPLVYGHDPALKTEMSDHHPARAQALLDLHGYVDRDGDGWRDRPDGTPLVLRYATQPDQTSRQLAEVWLKSMNAVGLRIAFQVAKWPENLKASRAGRLMMWGVAWGAETPDGDTFLALGYGPNKGGANHARFALPAFDALYQRQRRLPDGPERLQAMEDAAKLLVAYMPYKVSSHRIATDLAHPWVVGYRRHAFCPEFWKYVDVDTTLQRNARR